LTPPWFLAWLSIKEFRSRDGSALPISLACGIGKKDEERGTGESIGGGTRALERGRGEEDEKGGREGRSTGERKNRNLVKLEVGVAEDVQDVVVVHKTQQILVREKPGAGLFDPLIVLKEEKKGGNGRGEDRGRGRGGGEQGEV
jgi:hypothetical protein